MKVFACLFSIFALLNLVRADEYEARTFTGADGAKLGYRLLIPKKYDAAQKYPVVLFLHGAGERGTDNAAQLKHGAPLFLKPEVREKYPCFVIAPQCPPEEKWSAVKDWKDGEAFASKPTAPMQLALGAVEAVAKEFSLDPDRLYITGLSMGGYGTWDAISRTPQKWAAAVPICGGGDASRMASAKNVPIWAFHGINDQAVPVERTRELIAALKAAGGAPLYSEYPYVAHDSWTLAYGEPELLPWLFAQRRGQPPVTFAKVAGEFAQPPSSEFPGEGTVQSGLWFRNLWNAAHRVGRREGKRPGRSRLLWRFHHPGVELAAAGFFHAESCQSRNQRRHRPRLAFPIEKRRARCAAESRFHSDRDQ